MKQKTDLNKLKRNIRVYGFMKMFTKRVFLPLTAIYLVEVGGLSLGQIAFLATLSAFVALLSEIPTGFFADRITRKASLYMSAGTLVIMSATLAVFPTFVGAIVATILESIGYAFLSGAGEALIHDTLKELGIENQYSKIVGRAQSVGLIGNIILVSLVGLTYKINPHLPFVCSMCAYSTLFYLTSRLSEPGRIRSEHNPMKDLTISLRSFVTKQTIWLFVTLGIASGVYVASSDFNNLIFKDLGMPPSLLGIVFGVASAFAILIGFKAQILKDLKLRTYLILDVVLCSGFLLIIGIFRSLTLMVVGYIIMMGFWRLRNIIYQHHILEIKPNVRNKATLLSTLFFFGRINELWVPFAITVLIHDRGYYAGYTVFGVVLLMVLVPLVFLAAKRASILGESPVAST